MKRPLALALIAVIFVLGVMVGILGTHAFYLKRVAEPGGLAEIVLDVTGNRMANRLDLRPDQRKEFDAILASTRDDIAAARDNLVGDLREIRARSAQRLAAILDDTQLETLRQVQAEEGQVFDRFLADDPGGS